MRTGVGEAAISGGAAGVASFTVGAGTVGGVFTPTLLLGAALGSFFGGLLNARLRFAFQSLAQTAAQFRHERERQQIAAHLAQFIFK